MSMFAGGPVRTTRLSFLAPDLVRQLDVPGYVETRYRESIAEVPVLDGESAKERRMREMSYLNLTRFVQILLDRKDRASMAVGLEVRVPFCDHRLVDYVFNAPWAMKAFDGREKSLLRAATRDILPDEIANRVKSPYPTTQDPSYAEAVRTRLRALAADAASPARPLLNLPAIEDALEHASGPDVRNAGEVVLQLDGWMRHNDVSIEV
jgi:asparagine synthase (glutamine-hydrolysing)